MQAPNRNSAIVVFPPYAAALPALLDALVVIKQTPQVLEQLHHFKEALVAEQDFELAKLARELSDSLRRGYDRAQIKKLLAGSDRI